MNTMQILPPTKGTVLKISVQADLGNVHMADVDFSCRFFKKTIGNSVITKKQDMIRISDDEYVAIVDSEIIGTGEYYVEFTANIPDTDVPSGIRKEVVTYNTGINVK